MSIRTTSVTSSAARSQTDWHDREDLRMVLVGVLFSALFTGVIWMAGARLDSIPHLPDQGASWYYWKLPAATAIGRISAWGLYLLHQLANWILIYRAQKKRLRYDARLHPENKLALAVNASFILLHFIQTHLWYDGLAQDLSIWSSQASVVVLLVWVLLMENRRRGLFFGKSVPFSTELIRFARKYHGYFFSWAIVYTFWYHPMEATSGHLIGFFYMFLLMLQGSLFFTRLHINRWWTLVQEILVVIHGTLVAVMQGNDLWPMFAFGFGGIFVITQMHGLSLSRRIRLILLGLYVTSALFVYSSRGWQRLEEIIRIPLIDYLAVLILALLLGLGIRMHRRWLGEPARSTAR